MVWTSYVSVGRREHWYSQKRMLPHRPVESQNRHITFKSQENKENLFSTPEEIWREIFTEGKFSFRQLVYCQRVCQAWRRIIFNKDVGQRLLSPLHTLALHWETWQQVYKRFWNCRVIIALDTSASMRLTDYREKTRFALAMQMAETIAKNVFFARARDIVAYSFAESSVYLNISNTRGLQCIRPRPEGITNVESLLTNIFKRHIDGKADGEKPPLPTKVFVISDCDFFDGDKVIQRVAAFSRQQERLRRFSDRSQIRFLRVGGSWPGKQFQERIKDDPDCRKCRIRDMRPYLHVAASRK